MSSPSSRSRLPADHLDVEPAVGIRVDGGQLHHAPDPVHRLDPVRCRPRSPRGSPRCRTAARACRRWSAGGAPGSGSGPRRRAAAASHQGTPRCSDGKIGSCRCTSFNLVPRPGHISPLGTGARPCPGPSTMELMIRRIDLRGRAERASADYRAVVPRADFDVEAALDVVRPICDAVRHRGVEAIIELRREVRRGRAERHRRPVSLRCTEALDGLDPAVRAGLRGVDRTAAPDLCRPSSSRTPSPRSSRAAP